MTTHELYINDTLVDLDKDVNIYLLYQSMLFTDLQSIVSNRSYNISLPKTDNNLRAINNYNLADRADESDGGLTFPRKYHKVRYYRNGITIFERGIGTLVGVDSRINFVFAWGNAENFQKLFDKKLNELTNTAYLDWSSSTKYYAGLLEDFKQGFLNVDFGQGSQIQYQHPCVRSKEILTSIADDNAISFDKNEDGDYVHELGDFVVPLTTKKGDERSLEAQSLTSAAFSRRYKSANLVWNYSSIDPDIRGLIDPMGLWTENDFAFDPLRSGVSKLRIMIDGFAAAHPKDDRSHLYRYEFNNQSLGKPKRTGEEFGNVIIYYPPVDTIVDVSDSYNDSSDKKLNSITIDAVVMAMPAILYTLTPPGIKVIPIDMPLTLPTIFPVMPNLPDITQADFIKGLMQLSGVFAYIKGENEIGFVSIDDIVAKKNKQSAKDWTDKLLNTAGVYNAPEGIEFKLDSFAQNNLCKYDDGDDDLLKGKYDGAIVVENETIEKEKECFTLPFAPTENVDYVSGEYKTKIAKIPVYTKDSDGKIEYNDDITARILRPKSLNTHVGASFEEMDMRAVIRTKYSDYQEVIRTPRVIKVRCLLNDYDLSVLDLTAPVYFEQYGNYYAILKVQAAADGVCKCEFLEI